MIKIYKAYVFLALMGNKINNKSYLNKELMSKVHDNQSIHEKILKYFLYPKNL